MKSSNLKTRGHADHGWLNAKHTFSFADYRNPERVRFGPLRVVNEDRIAPGMGFDMHPHRGHGDSDLSDLGSIEHKDSMGNHGVITAGEVQRMTPARACCTANSIISSNDELHLLQIWIFPEEKNLEPGYEQKPVPREEN